MRARMMAQRRLLQATVVGSSRAVMRGRREHARASRAVDSRANMLAIIGNRRRCLSR